MKNKLVAGALIVVGAVPIMFGFNDITLSVGYIGLAIPLIFYKGDVF